MKDYALIHGKIILENAVDNDSALVVKNGRIDRFAAVETLPPNLPIIDLKGDFLSPGFVDMHIHGCEDISIDDAVTEDGILVQLRERLQKHGVTHFLPTMMANPHLISRLASEMQGNRELGQSIPGLYVEGPFVNSERRGGILPEFVRAGDTAYLDELNDLSHGLIRMMTVAPEISNSEKIIKSLVDMDIVPSFGHSNAVLADAVKMMPDGPLNITHLFNAMSEFSHKRAGLSMLPFVENNVFFELNGDGIHLNRETIKIALRCLNPKRMILISDAVISAGLPYGKYSYYGRKVTSDAAGVRYSNNQVLVGSNMTIERIVKNAIDLFDLSYYDAVRLVTLNPCTLLNIESDYGSIAPGKKACFTIFDADFNIRRTILPYS
jgi:N-acetylglucosamine-6-phosphate deacetylase